jgi:[NiFe] hydrogenase diaphorase moiety small subunit
MIVENETEQVQQIRKNIVEMLFVEGNHFCMFCEKSGNCELQAMAYRFGIAAPKFPYSWPHRDVDASHPDILIDRNRCILCARCVRTSRDIDGKSVFGFVGRGPEKRIAVNADAKLGDTNVEVTDKAISACPVGALLPKRVGYEVPVGQRLYDIKPIGSEIGGKTTST